MGNTKSEYEFDLGDIVKATKSKNPDKLYYLILALQPDESTTNNQSVYAAFSLKQTEQGSSETCINKLTTIVHDRRPPGEDSNYKDIKHIDIPLAGADIDWSVKVTFNPDGGNLAASESKKTLIYGQQYADDLPTPERAGFTFVGWYTRKNGRGSKITRTSRVNSIKDYTLYAFWRKPV